MKRFLLLAPLLVASFVCDMRAVSAQVAGSETTVQAKRSQSQLKADFEKADAERNVGKAGSRERGDAAQKAQQLASDMAWLAFDAGRNSEAADWFARSSTLKKEHYENLRAYYETEIETTKVQMKDAVVKWQQQLEKATDEASKQVLQNFIDTMPLMLEYNLVSMLESLASQNHDYPAALKYYTRELQIRQSELHVLKLRKAPQNKIDVKQTELAKALERLANAQAQLALFDDAEKNLLGALAIRRALPTQLAQRQLEESLGGLGYFYFLNTGEFTKARDYYLQALKSFEENAPIREAALAAEKTAENKDIVRATHALTHGSMLNNLCSVSQERGDYKAALEYSNRALKVAQELPPGGYINIFELARAQLRARALANRADIYAETGELALALKDIEETLQIKRALGEDESIARALMDAARLLMQTEDAAAARRNVEQARQIFIGAQNLRSVTMTTATLAVMLRDEGKLDEAAKLAEESLATARQLDMRVGLGATARILASIRLRQKRLADAAVLLQEAEKVDERSGSTIDKISTLDFQGQVLEAQGNATGAIEKYQSAITLLESVRATTASESGFSDVRRNYQIYERMVRLLLRQNRAREAFDYLGRAKSKLLHDSLKLASIQSNDTALQALLDQASTLQERTRTLEVQKQTEEAKPQAERSVEKIENIKKLLADTQGQYLTVSLELQEKAGGSLRDIISVEPLQLNEYQSGIPSDTIFVQYMPMGESLYVFLVTSDSLKIYELQRKPEELWKRVRAVRSQIAAKQSLPARGARLSIVTSTQTGTLSDNLTSLYSMLIEPIEADIAPKKTVAFLPTQMLYYLPFQALAKKQSKGLRYLAEDKQVVYLNAPNSVKVLLPHPAKKQTGLLAFGNPTGADLPAAEEEVKTIAQFFPATRALYGSAVTKEAVTDAANFDTRIVHFATHGVLNPNAPKASYIQLAKEPQKAESHLAVTDVLRLPLRQVDLVTLSACQTALGEGNPNGGEIISLASMFSSAGALTVVASLWSVADESTRDLMVEFYKQLAAGKTKGEAMQLAQLKVMKDPRYEHPYYWSPFILMGDWR